MTEYLKQWYSDNLLQDKTYTIVSNLRKIHIDFLGASDFPKICGNVTAVVLYIQIVVFEIIHRMQTYFQKH